MKILQRRNRAKRTPFGYLAHYNDLLDTDKDSNFGGTYPTTSIGHAALHGDHVVITDGGGYLVYLSYQEIRRAVAFLPKNSTPPSQPAGGPHFMGKPV